MKPTAVITTCQNDFERYKATQRENIQPLLRKISVLKDVQETEYRKCVLLVESRNVPDAVVREVKKLSWKTDNLSNNVIY